MEFFADTWFLWIILSAVCVGAVIVNRQSRQFNTGFVMSAEEFSVKTVLFGLRKGEGDLFLGFMLAVLFFAFFLAGFIRWVTTIL
jgi:hypothetical protein